MGVAGLAVPSRAPSPPPREALGRGTLAALAALVVATWVAYWPCYWGGFIWDDNSYVLYNENLRDVRGLWRIWFEPTATPQYHPLVFSSFWIEYQLWGDSTLGYHLVNVGLHAANAVVLWAILRRLRVPGALLAAAVFALHPVHVESVAWISERKDVLSAFFYGATMWWWIGYIERGRERDWVIALGLAACTLLSKTILCTLPAALLLVAWWKAPGRWRDWLVRLVPFLLISMPIAWVTIWREHSHGNPPLPYTLPERVLIAGRALWTHVGLLVWPAGLTIVYDSWPVSVRDPRAWLYPLAVLAVGAALAAGHRRLGWGPFVGAVFFVLTLAPTLGFVDYNIMRYAFVADHFQYVAGAGLIAVAAAAVDRAGCRFPSPVPRVAGVVLLAVLAVLTWRQAELYADPDVLWRDNVAKNPRSWVGQSYIATSLMRDDRYEEAERVLRDAVEAMPENVEAHRTLAIVIASLGRPEVALDHLRAARALDPGHARTENSIGTVLLSLGRAEEAESHFAAAVRLDPEYGAAWHYRAIAALQLGRRDEAVVYLQKALRLDPGNEDARATLAGLAAAR